MSHHGIALASLLLAGAPPAPAEEPRHTLLAAEWAFIRHAQREGIKASFLAVFHPEAIFFRPQAMNCPATFSARPDTGAVLSWYPAVAEASTTGDLGYTTGPSRYWTAPGAQEVHHGWFVSLWRREGRGPWKLMVDLGTSCPAPTAAPQPLPELKDTPRPLADGVRPVPSPDLQEADRAFARACAQAGPLKAYRATGLEGLRIYREGAAPAVGFQALAALFPAQTGVTLSSEPAWSLASHAGDLGCTHGTLVRTEAGKPFRAAYVRIWKRPGGTGAWRLALEIEKPLQEAR